MLVGDRALARKEEKIGDRALAGKEENIQDHYFRPDDTRQRKIYFKGHYLSIYNEQTGDRLKHINLEVPTTTFEAYEVPAGYTVSARVCTVYFTS